MTKKKRIIICLSDVDFKRLDIVKNALHTKQNSKAITFLLDIYCNYIKE